MSFKDETTVTMTLTVRDLFSLIVILDQTVRRIERSEAQNVRKGRTLPNGQVLTATGVHRNANPYKLERNRDLRQRLNAALESLGLSVEGLSRKPEEPR